MHNLKICSRIIILLVGLSIGLNAYADGSKDLYPATAQGGRAKLKSWPNHLFNSESFPFPELATHFVYAEAGELIAMANSEIGYGNSRIILTRPDGTTQDYLQAATEESNVNLQGRISNRAQELAGPRPNGTTADGRYRPFYHAVTQTGIYKVEFVAPGETDGAGRVTANGGLLATENWRASGAIDHNSAMFSAWDITVFSNNTPSAVVQKGRVYMNMLCMEIYLPGTPVEASHFFGVFYALTKDGYVYRVDNNGNNGYGFTFYVNNKGFHDDRGVPIYKSLNTSALATVQSQSHDPRMADTESDITHKLFYTNPLDPEVTLPAESSGVVPGGETWLKSPPKTPSVQEVAVIGMDGTAGQMSNKGGNIRFRADMTGTYTITITSVTPGFTTRVMTGTAIAGTNNRYWDGRDGAGIEAPVGTFPVNITVQLHGAEVHFPFIDMEINPDGFILELLNAPGGTPDDDRFNVYWNDSDLFPRTSSNNTGSAPSPQDASTNPQDSRTNGHKWGENVISSSGSGFGNARSIDTWTYILGEEESVDTGVEVKSADLKITLVETDKENTRIDEDVEYTVKVKNGEPGDGGSDVEGAPFTFTLPPGFEPAEDPQFSGNGCGSESVAIVYDEATHTYNSALNLSNGCEITYTFRATVTESSDPEDTHAVAAILRPNDVTDPNATNSSDPENPMYELPAGRTWDDLWRYPADWPDADDVDNYYIPPFSAEFECEYNSGEDCNNIGTQSVGLLRESDLGIVKSVDKSIPEIDEEIIFTLTVTNYGPHTATGIVITDTVPAGFTIGTINDDGTGSVSGTENIITWAVPELVKDGAISVSFTATVNNTGPYVNIAAVTGEGEDPDPDNNTDTETASPKNNYWIGGKIGAPNDWGEEDNWTGGYVPEPGQDIEFATEDNNGMFDPDVPNSGPAKDHLYLDNLDQDNSGGRIIGNLINNSDKDLMITTGNQLTINGEVEGKTEQSDGSFGTGTIVVKSTNIDTNENEPSGTLLFTDPSKNQGVGAIVEFYNQAYDCADCGFYTRSWQYFGIPVKGSEFPYDDVHGTETVNQWVEPFNGNKWQAAPYAPETELQSFKGYQITNDVGTQPDEVYRFSGTLYVGDATVEVSRTADVNYSGVNLVGNSYTAAIPISTTALAFPPGVEETVYLFNTGTRDQWRKLNGTAINQDGYRSGQYLSVPVNLGGQGEFPDRIPSMQTFMLLVDAGTTLGDLGINYSALVKNTTVNRGNGEQIVTRSSGSEGTTATSESSIPSLVMDVIGEESADRVWIFAKGESSYGFDNGWDGRKMTEIGIAQLYVGDEAGKERFQVATVPGLDNLPLGFEAAEDGKYTIEFALSDHWTTEEIYLHDLFTGTRERVTNGGSYSFEAKAGDPGARFRLSYSGAGIPEEDEGSKITVSPTSGGKIAISNKSRRDCTVFISGTDGKFLQRLEVRAGDGQEVENMSSGIYIVRLQNAVVNDVRKVIVE